MQYIKGPHLKDIKFIEPCREIAGDGLFFKKLIKRGSGVSPTIDDMVTINVTYLSLSTMSPETISFILGYMFTISGIEIACQNMKVGEISIFQFDPLLAYGYRGLNKEPLFVPPDHKLVVQIHMLSKGKPERSLFEGSVDHILGNSEKLREKGKYHFMRGEILQSIYIYEMTKNRLENALNNIPDNEKLYHEISILDGNLATCNYKLNLLKKARFQGLSSVMNNPSNLRAVSRYLDILQSLKLYDDGIHFIKSWMSLFPSIKDELQEKLDKFQALPKKSGNK